MVKLPDSIAKLVEDLARAPGVVGIVLGGSRARGRNQPDADVDLGLYYDGESFEWASVVSTLEAHDDARNPRGLAPPGAWGPWMNGGAWIRIGGLAVDVLLRDLGFVEGIARDARKGSFSSNYLPGHPHGWHSFMLLSEVFYNLPLADDASRLRALRDCVDPYPEALRAAVADRFLFEARFSALLLGKIVGRDDVAQSAGLSYRCAMCMVHALFALNRTYLVNEKGAVAVARSFEHVPPGFCDRVDEALGSSALSNARRHELLSALVEEVEALVRREMDLVATWDMSSFPTT
ncbi:MAG: nucleotidyltransferase domain-containing protein [Kofleriaceae bacterium]